MKNELIPINQKPGPNNDQLILTEKGKLFINDFEKNIVNQSYFNAS